MWWLILLGGFIWYVVAFRYGMQSARALREELWPDRFVIGGGIFVGVPAMFLAVSALDLVERTVDWPWFVQAVLAFTAFFGIAALLFAPGSKMKEAREEAQAAKDTEREQESRDQARAHWYRNVTDGTPWPGDVPDVDAT